MVTIQDLQKRPHKKSKGIKDDFDRIKRRVKDISENIKDYEKKRIYKHGFQQLMMRDLALLVSAAAMLANSSKISITQQFEEWHGKKTIKKKMVAAKGYTAASELYDDPSNLAFAVEGKKLTRLIGNVKNKKVLDVGCGTGRYSSALAKKGAIVTGIDISEGMLRVARKNSKKLKIDYKKADMCSIPFPAETFDCIISSLAIDHVKNFKKALGEMLRVCRKNGTCVVSIIHPDTFKKKVEDRGEFRTKEGMVLIKSYKRTKRDFSKALGKKAHKIKFFDLNVPVSAKKLNPLVYRFIKNKNFVLVVKFCKK